MLSRNVIKNWVSFEINNASCQNKHRFGIQWVAIIKYDLSDCSVGVSPPPSSYTICLTLSQIDTGKEE